MYKCNICDFTYFWKQSLTRHINDKHSQDLKMVEIDLVYKKRVKLENDNVKKQYDEVVDEIKKYRSLLQQSSMPEPEQDINIDTFISKNEFINNNIETVCDIVDKELSDYDAKIANMTTECNLKWKLVKEEIKDAEAQKFIDKHIQDYDSAVKKGENTLKAFLKLYDALCLKIRRELKLIEGNDDNRLKTDRQVKKHIKKKTIEIEI